MPIGAGAGTVPDDSPTVVADMPTLVVEPGGTARAWVMFLGYRFDGSEVARRVTVNVPGPDGENLRVTVADPARGALRWRLPAQRSQLMVGFQNSSFLGGAFQGLAPATGLARVARLVRFCGTSVSSPASPFNRRACSSRRHPRSRRWGCSPT